MAFASVWWPASDNVSHICQSFPQQQPEAGWYGDVLNLYSGDSRFESRWINGILNEIRRSIPQALQENAEIYFQTA